MADLNAVVARYLDVWNEADADRRAKAIGELFTENAVYTDPLADVSGHDGVGAVIAGAQEQFAGLRFEQLGDVDAHHNIARFRWGLVTEPGAEPIAIGFDVAVTTEDGRIDRVYGFLDKVPGA
ncbi:MULTISPECIES: nuclear transport factor 2 family protein [Streptomyces]|uniref:Nuclear transport factor 2 family protein n=2 Tax=Streptomyces TaxID=1883 RepID=A0A5P0YVP8_9ACTN|nr:MULTISPECIES: nuclear transport factor 2 family protein [Streptomyces]MBB1242941.1 nuclear transport factor 2 family protein [Streptomyces durbertensis]MBB1254956.1 nuclear transport factor 2 family protein [Streptomyces alkaliterrae]MBB1261276.1 nuclear transport factor 2 family protein [Streptomyces alkaliterrae]MQS02549.1 nuclear transport factor 2 family protein [Streptomyces alkaliterrae]